MATARSTWTVKDALDMLKIVTGSQNESDITAPLALKMFNASVPLVVEQLEAILFPFLFKQSPNIAVAGVTESIFAKATGVGGTYSSANKTITLVPTNNVHSDDFVANQTVLVHDGAGVFNGIVASYNAGTDIITLKEVLSPSGCSVVANAIVWIVGLTAPVGTRIVTLPVDCKKLICVKDSTTGRVIEMFDERKFKNAQSNSNYDESAFCYVVEDKIYIYVGASYGSTVSDVSLDYIRKTDKLSSTALTETIDIPDEYVFLIIKSIKQIIYELRDNVNGSVGAANDLSGTIDRLIGQAYPNNIGQTETDRNLNAARGGKRN
jgi:hypothetical protein